MILKRKKKRLNHKYCFINIQFIYAQRLPYKLSACRDIVPQSSQRDGLLSIEFMVCQEFHLRKSDFLSCVLLIRNYLSSNNMLFNYLSLRDINRQYQAFFFSFLRNPSPLSKEAGKIRHSMN